MHDGQLEVTVDTVRRLLADQFPQWSNVPVVPVEGSGTVNAIFRIGDHHAARFPLVVDDPRVARHIIDAEADAARELSTIASVPTPVVLAIGDPGRGYPGPWSVSTWLDGSPATPDGLACSTEFAADVAGFIRELRDADTHGRAFSGGGRGGDLRAHDAWIEECLAKSVGHFDAGPVDVDALDDAWRSLRELPRHSPDVMSHKDLIPANLLIDQGRLTGVLDVGGFGPADPALDLVVAWHVFDDGPRAELRRGLGSDDLEWKRGAAWAYVQAMGLVWYYARSNPTMSALGRSTLERVIASSVASASVP
ncbi:aminoglycoside phosphotransferase family protein [Humibacter soli]